MINNEPSPKEAVDQLFDIQQLFRLAMERRPQHSEGHLTRLQQFLLTIIARKGPLPIAELVRILDVGPTTVSQFIRTLESRGFVSRTFDPEDRRRHVVHLTDAGRTIVEQTMAQRRSRLQRVLEDLTGEERAQMVHLARRLADILGRDPDLLRGGV